MELIQISYNNRFFLFLDQLSQQFMLFKIVYKLAVS